LFDPGREQVYHFSDAGRAPVWPAGLDRDNRAATRSGSDVGTEPLNAHGLIVAR
jgi:hypothetical protein